MPLRPGPCLSLVLSLSALSASARAQSPRASDDPSSAYALLLRGYELKLEGRCAEARVPLEASYRAEPTTKALINLAQCEAILGEVVRARTHLQAAVELARRKDPPRVAIAEESLAGVERRVALLSLDLVEDAPPGTTTRIDGASVSAAEAIPLDPGPHAITATAPGGAPRAYAITLTEGEHTRLTVDFRAPASPAGPSEAAPPTASARRTIGIALAGAGLVGLGVGTYFGLRAHSKNSDSNADGHCDATGCDPVGFDLRSDARSAATVSTIGLLAGGAALAAGVVLVVTGLEGKGGGALRVGPTGYARGAGIVAALAW